MPRPRNNKLPTVVHDRLAWCHRYLLAVQHRGQRLRVLRSSGFHPTALAHAAFMRHDVWEQDEAGAAERHGMNLGAAHHGRAGRWVHRYATGNSRGRQSDYDEHKAEHESPRARSAQFIIERWTSGTTSSDDLT